MIKQDCRITSDSPTLGWFLVGELRLPAGTKFGGLPWVKCVVYQGDTSPVEKTPPPVELLVCIVAELVNAEDCKAYPVCTAYAHTLQGAIDDWNSRVSTGTRFMQP